MLPQSAPAALAVKRSQWLQPALWTSKVCYKCILQGDQAAEEDGHLAWSPINLVSHWDLAGEATFVRLSTVNGTALTLAANHMVYVSRAAAGLPRVPARAVDIQVRQ